MLRKLVLWALACLAISLLFLGNPVLSWTSLSSCGLYPWAILFLCTLWIYVKREEQVKRMQSVQEKVAGLPHIFLGAVVLAVSFLLPGDAGLPFIVFEMLLAYLGLFVMFFGSAALLPGLLLGIYGFSVGFHAVIEGYMDPQYSLATTWMVVTALKASGFQLVNQGQVISFTSVSGNEIPIFINAACSGSASMTIFLALFALMMLDVRLPAKSALYMLAFGIVGTTAQNVLRLIVLILAGRYYDFPGLVTAHSYAGYILFPAWYLVFAYVYMRCAQSTRERG